MRGTVPVFRQTRTVSMIEDPVPLMWIEAPISAGHGNEAEHVLVAKQVGKINRERLTHRCVLDLGNPAATQFQANKLPRVEQFPVAVIPPAMEPLGFVFLGYGILWRKLPRFPLGPFLQARELYQVFLVRSLEKPPLALAFGQGTRHMIFHREEPMPKVLSVRIGKGLAAVKASSPPSGGRVFCRSVLSAG